MAPRVIVIKLVGGMTGHVTGIVSIGLIVYADHVQAYHLLLLSVCIFVKSQICTGSATVSSYP